MTRIFYNVIRSFYNVIRSFYIRIRRFDWERKSGLDKCIMCDAFLKYFLFWRGAGECGITWRCGEAGSRLAFGCQVLGTKNVPTHVPREPCRDSMLSVLFCWRVLESPEKVAHVNDFLSCGACGGSSSQHYRALSMAASVCLEEIVTAARRYMSFASHHALRHGPYRLVVRTSRCGGDNPGSTPGGTFASCVSGSDSRSHAFSH